MKKFSLKLVMICVLTLFFFVSAEAKTRLVFQTPFVPGTWDHQWGKNFVDRVNTLAAGRLEIVLQPPGAIVPPFEILTAVHKGVLDGGLFVPLFSVGRNSAFSLFASAAGGPFGMSNWDFIAWMFAGGGNELYRDLLYRMKFNVVWFPVWGEMSEPLGWFRKPVKTAADMKGIRFRAAGLAADVFRELGVPVTILSAGEIMPALERGVIDGTELSDPHTDMTLGFHEILKFYHLPGIHQTAGVGEVFFNRTVWDKIPADLKVLIELAAHEALLKNMASAWEINIQALEDLQKKHGVTVVETPREILVEFLRAWDRVAAREAAKNPDFARVYEAQRKFASRHVPYQRIINPDYSIAAEHYWGRKK